MRCNTLAETNNSESYSFHQNTLKCISVCQITFCVATYFQTDKLFCVVILSLVNNKTIPYYDVEHHEGAFILEQGSCNMQSGSDTNNNNT